MELLDILKMRHSVRAYLDTPVDQNLLEDIFNKAQLSPSNCNTQPWHVSVISGDLRKALEEALVADVAGGGAPSPVFRPGDKDLQGPYRKRQIDCAIALYDAVGIKFEDKPARQMQMLRNWQFFGAPHVAFISMPKEMGPVNAVDVGIYVQTLMLLMAEAGLGCCPQGALGAFPKPIYEMGAVPETHGILCGLSFGYEDTDAPINQYRVARDEYRGAVQFIG